LEPSAPNAVTSLSGVKVRAVDRIRIGDINVLTFSAKSVS
jgi:hypothetical protein